MAPSFSHSINNNEEDNIMEKSRMTYTELTASYIKMPLENDVAGKSVWVKKGQHSLQIDQLVLNPSSFDPSKLFLASCVLVKGAAKKKKDLLSHYLLDVICESSPESFVSTDNGLADWYLTHASAEVSVSVVTVKPPKATATVTLLSAQGPTRDYPTKMSLSGGGSFPVEFAFPTQLINNVVDFALLVSLPAEKDSAGINPEMAMQASWVSSLLAMQLRAAKVIPTGDDLPSMKGFIEWIADEFAFPGAIVVTHAACQSLAANFPNGIELLRKCHGVAYESMTVTDVPTDAGGPSFDALLVSETANRHIVLKYRLKAHLKP